MDGFSVFIVVLFVLLSQSSLASSLECDTIPLSISDLDLCTDGVCTVNKHVAGIVGTQERKFCFTISDPITGDKVEDVNLVIAGSYAVSPVSNCYWTDDFLVDVAIKCGCPGGSSGICTTGKPVPKYHDLEFNLEGHHRDKQCALAAVFGRSGDWCASIGMSFLKRYRVCQVAKNPTVRSAFMLSRNGNSSSIDLTGTALEVSDESFKLTVHSHTYEHVNCDFVVYDSHDTGDFYCLPSSVVNARTEFNWRKIGAFKISAQNNGIKSPIDIDMIDCHKNAMSINSSALVISDFLRNNGQYRSFNAAPGSELHTTHQISQPRWNNLDHSSEVPAVVGSPIFYTANGRTPVSFGYLDSRPTLVEEGRNWVVWNHAMFTVHDWFYATSGYTTAFLSHANAPAAFAAVLEKITNQSDYAYVGSFNFKIASANAQTVYAIQAFKIKMVNGNYYNFNIAAAAPSPAVRFEQTGSAIFACSSSFTEGETLITPTRGMSEILNINPAWGKFLRYHITESGYEGYAMRVFGWPSFEVGWIAPYMYGNFTNTKSGFRIYYDVEYDGTRSEELMVKPTNEAITFTLTVKGVRFQVHTVSTSASGLSCHQKSDAIACDVSISPKTGLCTVSFLPAIAESTSIADGGGAFSLKANYDGDVTVSVFCSKKGIKTITSVIFNGTDDIYTIRDVSMKDVPHFLPSKKNMWYDGILSLLMPFSNWLGGTWGTVADVFMWIVVGVLSIFSMYVIFWMYRAFRMRGVKAKRF